MTKTKTRTGNNVAAKTGGDELQKPKDNRGEKIRRIDRVWRTRMNNSLRALPRLCFLFELISSLTYRNVDDMSLGSTELLCVRVARFLPPGHLTKAPTAGQRVGKTRYRESGVSLRGYCRYCNRFHVKTNVPYHTPFDSTNAAADSVTLYQAPPHFTPPSRD